MSRRRPELALLRKWQKRSVGATRGLAYRPDRVSVERSVNVGVDTGGILVANRRQDQVEIDLQDQVVARISAIVAIGGENQLMAAGGAMYEAVPIESFGAIAGLGMLSFEGGAR